MKTAHFALILAVVLTAVLHSARAFRFPGMTFVTATKGGSAPNSIGAGADGTTSGTVTIADETKVTQN